jgi:hypothetical protein
MFRSTSTAVTIASVLTAVSLTHCTGDDGGEHGPNHGGEGGYAGDVSCVDDERVDTYTAKLLKPGTRGVLSFELTSSEPAPPAKGSNAFSVRILDEDGAALEGELGIALDMPDHGHGTSVTPVVSFDPPSGIFTLAPVHLFMPGVWRVELDFRVEGSEVDRAVFHFCIEG